LPPSSARSPTPISAWLECDGQGIEGGETGTHQIRPRFAADRNDETLDRIYIDRRFRNGSERLEKLYERYTQMTAKQANASAKGTKKPGGQRKKG
jgi:hypothetical protein